MASRNDPETFSLVDPPRQPGFARLLLTFAAGAWLLGAGFGFAAWVGYRTFVSLNSLFPVP